jgi:hypothetical protein
MTYFDGSPDDERTDEEHEQFDPTSPELLDDLADFGDLADEDA